MHTTELINHLLGEMQAEPGLIPDREGRVAGEDIEVRGIAVSYAASLRVLQHAVESGCNLLIADTHPYYFYDPLWSGVPGAEEAVMGSAMVARKVQFIGDNGLAVVRLKSAWEAFRPLAGALDLADRIGWTASGDTPDFVVCDVPTETLTGQAREIRERTGAGAIRIIGDGSLSVSRVALSPGLLTPEKLARILRSTSVQAVVTGEVIEWEAGPYMQDAITAGAPAALLQIGFACSMEPGSTRLADWVRAAVPNIPVVRMESGDPIWSPS